MIIRTASYSETEDNLILGLYDDRSELECDVTLGFSSLNAVTMDFKTVCESQGSNIDILRKLLNVLDKEFRDNDYLPYVDAAMRMLAEETEF